MKKVFTATVFALAVASLSFGAYTYGQCQAIAKSTGKQCKHGVSKKGDLYCWQHKK
jgi:hypothetical protein